MYITEITNVIIPTSSFYNLFLHSQIETDSSFSRPEIALILACGASISVFDIQLVDDYTNIQ